MSSAKFSRRLGFLRLSSLMNKVNRWTKRNYTAIALGVLALGLLLTIIGPLRLILTDGRSPAANLVTGTGGSALDETAEGSSRNGPDPFLLREMVPFTIIPDRPRNEVVTYMVQPGDTIMAIANSFGLDRTTVFWANAERLLGDVHQLQSGMELFILPTDGVYHRASGTESIREIAAQYSVEPEAIINSEFNQLAGLDQDQTPGFGTRIVVPEGVGELADWRPPIVPISDPITGQTFNSFMPGMSGSCSPSILGGGGSNAWIVPMGGGWSVTQTFYPGHSGIDLGGAVGSPILAADTGVVIFSGWVDASWGYGILVVLDHGNGWTSYYAHLNSTVVGCGQTVRQYEPVGTLGSTGNSSGPHLHFELRYNHVPDNPAFYIPF
ncbi:MAG: peptidoglycan DD-metalloendopeptidase family protein [Chloroflexi bacterium]|nr:peptidoglycan DD-metalloendopeptidase family protein [Chloroflexota bacterium]